MAEAEVDRIVVRLIGEDDSYQKMADKADATLHKIQKTVTETAKKIELSSSMDMSIFGLDAEDTKYLEETFNKVDALGKSHTESVVEDAATIVKAYKTEAEAAKSRFKEISIAEKIASFSRNKVNDAVKAAEKKAQAAQKEADIENAIDLKRERARAKRASDEKRMEQEEGIRRNAKAIKDAENKLTPPSEPKGIGNKLSDLVKMSNSMNITPRGYEMVAYRMSNMLTKLSALSPAMIGFGAVAAASAVQLGLMAKAQFELYIETEKYNRALEESERLNARLGVQQAHRQQRDLGAADIFNEESDKKQYLTNQMETVNKEIYGVKENLDEVRKKKDDFFRIGGGGIKDLWRTMTQGRVGEGLIQDEKEAQTQLDKLREKAQQFVNALGDLKFKEEMRQIATLQRENAEETAKTVQLLAEGERIGQSQFTNAQKYNKEVEKLDDLLKRTHITQKEHDEGVKRAEAARDTSPQDYHDKMFKDSERRIESNRTAYDKYKDTLEDLDYQLKQMFIDQETYNKEAAKAEAARDTSPQERFDKLFSNSEQLNKKFKDPLRSFKDAQEELNEMLKEGLIDQTNYNKAMQEAKDLYHKETGGVQALDAALTKSSTAYSRILEYRNKMFRGLNRRGVEDPVFANKDSHRHTKADKFTGGEPAQFKEKALPNEAPNDKADRDAIVKSLNVLIGVERDQLKETRTAPQFVMAEI